MAGGSKNLHLGAVRYCQVTTNLSAFRLASSSPEAPPGRNSVPFGAFGLEARVLPRRET